MKFEKKMTKTILLKNYENGNLEINHDITCPRDHQIQDLQKGDFLKEKHCTEAQFKQN